MNRRTFLKLTAGATIAATAGACGRADRGARTGPPNLLFVMADQWRYSAFGHTGAAPLSTPVLDRFAAESVSLTRAYAANPLCSPSRASVMTGRLPHQHRVIDNDLMLPPSEHGFAESFRDAGYATHYIGKWHLDGPEKPGFVPPGWRRRGFETFEGFNRGHDYENFEFYTNDGELVRRQGFEPTDQTDRAIAFLRDHVDRPFFCFLSWGPPHGRVGAPEVDLPAWSEWSASFEWPANVPDWLRRSDLLKRKWIDYYTLCEALDREMGRLLAALDDLGLAERTIVVFTSDHGDLLGAHGKLNKESPYEEALRVPLFVRLPSAAPAGLALDTLTSGIDLAPTLTSLCGLAPPQGCAGRDLSPALEGGAVDADVPSLYAEGGMERRTGRGRRVGSLAWRALVTPTHKLVLDVRDRVALLVDLADDPFELHDLAGDPAVAALEAELVDRLRAWGARTRDPFPEPTEPARDAYAEPAA